MRRSKEAPINLRQKPENKFQGTRRILIPDKQRRAKGAEAKRRHLGLHRRVPPSSTVPPTGFTRNRLWGDCN